MVAHAEAGVGDLARSKVERLDRGVVRAATLTAAVFLVALVVLATATGDSRFLVRAMAPGTVSAVGLWQLYHGRPHALSQILAAAAVIVADSFFLGFDPTTRLGLLGMLTTGVLFVRRRAWLYIAGGAALLYATDVSWQPQPAATDGLATWTLGPPLLFVFVAFLVHWMRRELEEGRARYQNLFYRAPVPIWELDCSGVSHWLEARRAEGVTDIRRYLDENPQALTEVASLAEVLDVNDAAVEFLGSSGRRSLLGWIRIDRVPRGSEEAFLAQLEALWEGKATATATLTVTRRDGSRVEGAMTSASRVRDGRVEPSNVIVTVTDVTERNRTERQLKELISSKDELVASVSHEVRTPLTAVVGLSEELRDRYAEFDGAEIQELVGMVAEQSTEVAHIVDDLLVASRRDAGSLRLDCSVLDMRREVTGLLAGTRSMGDVGLTCRGEGPRAFADPARVRQILRNLLVNAQRYGGGSTRVLMWTGDDTSHVEVRDSGAAISADDREAIFDPYVRGRQVNGLTASVGLGLTISRQLARLMGGDVTYAHDGAESIFTLTLPSARNGDGQPIEARTSASAGSPVSASS